MNTESYFAMIITVLIGLTFIVLILAFIYMVYGEKEERASSSKAELFRNSKSLFLRSLNLLRLH